MADREKQLIKKIGDDLKCKLQFGKIKLEIPNVSSDGHFIIDEKLYIVEVDSDNKAKGLVGEYLLINALFKELTDTEIRRLFEDNLEKVIFLVIQFHLDNKPIRTFKNLELVKKYYDIKMGIKVIHEKDFQNFIELKKIIT